MVRSPAMPCAVKLMSASASKPNGSLNQDCSGPIGRESASRESCHGALSEVKSHFACAST
ncbi:Uncharacterised protein [Vibrio cholerae]|nr:Uncharacterised protein [Vibrio cholerae]